MVFRFNDRMETLYIVIGCLNLAVAFFVNLGVLFSSIGFAFLATLLIGLPLFVGLIGVVIYPRLSTGCMMFGCTMIMAYLSLVSYYDLKSGYSPIVFHRIWFVINATQITLAVLRVKQLNRWGAIAQ